MRFMLDIDGPVAEFMPVLNEFYNRMAGTSFTLEDYKYHDLEKTWDIPRHDVTRTIRQFYQSPEFLDIKPVEYSVECIKILSLKNHLFSITSRPENIRRKTEFFLKSNFGRNIRRVIYTGQHHLPASEINKFDVCYLERADVIVEDCLEVALDCARLGIEIFLLDRPWNRLNGKIQVPKNISRVKNWLEILEALK